MSHGLDVDDVEETTPPIMAANTDDDGDKANDNSMIDENKACDNGLDDANDGGMNDEDEADDDGVNDEGKANNDGMNDDDGFKDGIFFDAGDKLAIGHSW